MLFKMIIANVVKVMVNELAVFLGLQSSWVPDGRQERVALRVVTRIIRVFELHPELVPVGVFLKVFIAILNTCVARRLDVLRRHIIVDRLVQTTRVFWLEIVLIKLLLGLDHLDVFFTADLSVTALHPWSLCQLLHLKESVRLELVLGFSRLELLLQVLLAVFTMVSEPQVLFDLLLKLLGHLNP
jgi:hypothetical protein